MPLCERLADMPSKHLWPGYSNSANNPAMAGNACT